METAISRLKSLTVHDVMSKQVVWVSARQSMVDVAAVLLRHEISSAPVVDEAGRSVGMITATDFLKRDAAQKQQAGPGHQRPPAWAPDDVVATYMTAAVQTIDARSSLLQAARVMCSQHVHRLPVVDGEGRPIGVISTMDLVAALTNVVEEENVSGGGL